MSKFEKGARLVAGGVWLAAVAFAVESCTVERNVGFADGADSGSPPAFTDPTEAGSDATATRLINYCPSNKCPAGHTTCPASFFPCDVDLNTDIQNCGACGVACPAATFRESFSCVDGRCVMTCGRNTGVPFLDCDGVPDNGCEVVANTNENCGGCGVKCLDPEKPCVLTTSTCGCPPGQTLCGLECIPTQADDANCGACENACDRAGDGGSAPPHMYFGCLSSTCGKLKCEPGWADCDDDIPGTGCEREVGTDTNCAGCGDNCLAQGQTCLRTPVFKEPYCGCPEGKTFCGSCESPGTYTVPAPDGGVLSFPLPAECVGHCFDLTSDIKNCGACGLNCNRGVTRTADCEFGACVQHCPSGRADCDGNPDCEVNTLSDPANCGGCGIVCDAVAGQACVGGRCVVEPCDQGDGGMAR